MEKKKFAIGIESTAHTFGVGIVSFDGEIIVNEKNTFKGEGMDLRKLTEFHLANFDKVLKNAFEKFKSKSYNLKDISLISFSQGPGIGNSLKIGAVVAKTLALKLDLPIVGVNHIKAHLEVGKLLTGFKDPLFLYVSGVNTQLIAKDIYGNYKIYGETEDIGLGNLLDSAGRVLGIEFPAGPKIEELAKKSKNFILFPYTVKGMNLSLGGLVTKIKQIKNKYSIEDICYSIQENVFAMVIEISERAIAYTKKKEFTIVGGVASNNRLREMALLMGQDRGIAVKFFSLEYCMDNGAMIAWQGVVDRERAKKDIKNLRPLPYITIETIQP